MKTKEQIGYDEIVAAGAAGLKPNEYWVIDHPDGPLLDTKSKDLTFPVRTICDALDADWDDLTEQGYRLSRVQL